MDAAVAETSSLPVRNASRTREPLEEAVRCVVGHEHVLHDAAADARGKEPPRREAAEEVAGKGVHARLVEGHPVADARAEGPAGFWYGSPGIRMMHNAV